MRKIVLVVAVALAVLAGTPALAQGSGPAVPALEVQKALLLDPTHLVIDGTIACRVGSDFAVSAKVTELAAQDGVRKSTVATGPCAVDGPQTWSVTVTGTGGTFVPVVTAFGSITDTSTQMSTANVVQGGVDIATS